MITIIHGPAGCGKTHNAEALRRAYGATRIVDGWTYPQPLQDGDLALTNTRPPMDSLRNRVQIIAFKRAAAVIGVFPRT